MLPLCYLLCLNLVMEPNQPTPQPNQYDFITNAPAPPKKPLFGGSMKSRIFLVVGALVALMIIATIVSSILSSAGQTTIRNLKSVIARQQEIIRVAELGAKDGLSVNTRNFAKTVASSLQTEQASLIDLLGKNGGKLSKAEQAAELNDNTDKILEAAKANNQYDEVLLEELQSQLRDYQTSLKTAYDSADGSNTREALSDIYDSAGILLGTDDATQ